LLYGQEGVDQAHDVDKILDQSPAANTEVEKGSKARLFAAMKPK
jgi:beta-lactam-binding protein with PASTA domain